MQYFEKQPYDNHDYDFDWEDWLEPTLGDTVQSAVITADAGITLGAVVLSDTRVKQFISGGTSGTCYKVTCQMTTIQGRKDERDIYIHVKEI